MKGTEGDCTHPVELHDVFFCQSLQMRHLDVICNATGRQTSEHDRIYSSKHYCSSSSKPSALITSQFSSPPVWLKNTLSETFELLHTTSRLLLLLHDNAAEMYSILSEKLRHQRRDSSNSIFSSLPLPGRLCSAGLYKSYQADLDGTLGDG